MSENPVREPRRDSLSIFTEPEGFGYHTPDCAITYEDNCTCDLYERLEAVAAEAAQGALDDALPYLRHRATCFLQAVRDNAPDDPTCDCGLREWWAAK